MKRFLYSFIVITVFVLFSCNNNCDFVSIYKSTFNDNGDWINFKTLGKYGGVKGEICSKVDSANEYSYGFSKLLSEISPNIVKRIKVSVWVKLTDLNKKCVLVVSVNLPNHNKSIYWQGQDINPSVKKVNEWTKIDVDDKLPDIDTNGALVNIYVWNPHKNIAFVDNYDIKFLNE